MRHKIFFLFLLLLLGLSALVIAEAVKDAGTVAVKAKAMSVTFPQGDVKAGKVVFRTMKCYYCHPVSGVEGQKIPFGPVSSSNPAPLLDSRLASMDPGELATSIVSPSHKVSSVVAEQSGGQLSPMGDFSQVLTVRQLVDLMAYLRSLSDEMTAK